MEHIYQAISIKRELPPVGKFVTTIDTAGEQRVYRINEDKTWSMRDLDGSDSPNNNLPVIYWLKESIDLDTCHKIACYLDLIKALKEKQFKILDLKNEIKEILKGHVEIPEEKVYDVFNDIDQLSDCLNINIEKYYSKLLNK